MRLDVPRSQRPYGPDETLAYYDGPLLFWLPAPGQHLLAIALPEDAGPWPFLVCQLSQAAAADVRLGALRGIVCAAEAWFLMRDYGAPLLELEPVAELPEEWLPG